MYHLRTHERTLLEAKSDAMKESYIKGGSKIPDEVTNSEARKFAQALIRDNALLKVLTSHNHPTGKCPSFIIEFASFYTTLKEGYGWASVGKLLKKDGGVILAADLDLAGWVYKARHCNLYSDVNLINACLVENALHRVIFEKKLDWH